MNKINLILKEILNEIAPSNKELKEIDEFVGNFKKKLEKEINKQKIQAEIFIGGSFAKKTLIKKEKYDIDIFLRFDKKYSQKDISKLAENLIKKFTKYKIIKGSRDYFRIDIKENLFIELIPVIKVSSPEKAENITDLSYLHVKYIKNKIKDEKILSNIKLAKAFCYSNNCYGAESYIKGFSGYSLELLVYYYKNFEKFLKEIIKIKDKKIIDIEKKHKNSKEVMINLNASKLCSPIILIDPTYKFRNTLAALSLETFEQFQKKAKQFLKNPKKEFFYTKKIDFEKIKNSAKKSGNDFVRLEIFTLKKEENVAGSKLYKFYQHLENEISRFFKIKNKGFEYNSKQKKAEIFFVAKKIPEIVLKGPFIDDKKNYEKFRKKHKNIYIKNKKAYSKIKFNFTLNKFLKDWKFKNKERIKEMSILDFKII